MPLRPASWFHLLLAAAHGAVASGLWFLALASLPVAKESGGEDFPCADRPCCCRSAADCRTSCCCTQPEPRKDRAPDKGGGILQAARCAQGASRLAVLSPLPPCVLEAAATAAEHAASDSVRIDEPARPPSHTPTPSGPVPRAGDVSPILV